MYDHDDALVENWNTKANENTVGFLLGDLVFGNKAEEYLMDRVNKMIFKELYIMPGNHTAGVKQLINKCEANEMTLGPKKLIFVPNYLEAFVNGKPVVMSHYPILSFNGQAKGSYMLFSHVHGHLEKSEVGRAYLNSGCRSLEMSVEKNPSPLTFKEIRTILDARVPVSFDHHDSNTQNPF